MTSPPDIDGRPGTLVDVLLELIFAEGGADPGRWFNWSFYLLYWLGGGDEIQWRPPMDVQPQDVRRAARARLRELLAQGVDEEFLVTSVLNALDRYLHQFADVGDTDRKRAMARESLQSTIDDPEKRQRFREHLTALDAQQADISDEELIARLQHMKDESIASPVTPEEAAKAWATLEEFRVLRESLLSEDLVRVWSSRNTVWQMDDSR